MVYRYTYTHQFLISSFSFRADRQTNRHTDTTYTIPAVVGTQVVSLHKRKQLTVGDSQTALLTDSVSLRLNTAETGLIWFGSIDGEWRCVGHCPVNGPALTVNDVV